MMRNDEDFKFGFIAGLTIGITGAALLAIAVFSNTSTKIQDDAIKRGFAEYNPINGQWQWKERVTNTVTVFHDVWQTNIVFVPTNTLIGGTLEGVPSDAPDGGFIRSGETWEWVTTNKVSLGAGE